MNSPSSLIARSRLFGKIARAFSLPAGLLVMLLQRTPVLRVAATAGEFVAAAPVGAVLKAMIATVATLGAVDSVAGASTQLATTSSLPAYATVGQPFTMAIYITGTGVSSAQSWDVTNTLPPGVTANGGGGHGGAIVQGSLLVISLSTGYLTFSGTPTTAGTYAFTARGYQFANGTGPVTTGSSYIIVAAAATTVPTIATQPLNQNVALGGTATFTVIASGSPAPAYQWRKNGVNVDSAIGSSLTLFNVQLADAGTYSVVIANSAGNVTSNGALLTVLSSPPVITVQPQSQTASEGATATFSVTATGAPSPAYQWQKNGATIAGATGSLLVISPLQMTDAGTYSVVVTNSAGSVTSNAAVLTVSPVAPAITAQPVSHTVAAGSTAVFAVQMTGSSVACQWMKDGTAIAGATSARLILSNAQLSAAGSYTVSLTNSSGAVTSAPATLGVVTTSDPGRIVNLSIRGTSGTGDKVLIMGFVAGGAGTGGTTRLLIRGSGETLVSYGVADAIADTQIQLIPAGSATPLATNDNWGGTAELKAAATALGAFPFLSDTSRDSAYLGNLASGPCSVIVGGKGGVTGSVIAEIYDANLAALTATTPRLVNISARAYVGGTDSLIAGFVIIGSTARTVLVRAVGPNPAFASAVGNASLGDPGLALYHAHDGTNTLQRSNDNWGGDPQLTTVGTSVGAQPLTDPASKDAVLLVTLDPGVYSTIDLGMNGTTGITLVEVYEVP